MGLPSVVWRVSPVFPKKRISTLDLRVQPLQVFKIKALIWLILWSLFEKAFFWALLLLMSRVQKQCHRKCHRKPRHHCVTVLPNTLRVETIDLVTVTQHMRPCLELWTTSISRLVKYYLHMHLFRVMLETIMDHQDCHTKKTEQHLSTTLWQDLLISLLKISSNVDGACVWLMMRFCPNTTG